MTELLDPMIAESIPDAYPDLSGFTRRARQPGLSEATWWPGVITIAIVASAVLYTFVHMSPDLVVAATTPAGFLGCSAAIMNFDFTAKLPSLSIHR